MIRSYLSEFLGTFLLVLIGCGAETIGKTWPLVFIAISWFLAVLIPILTMKKLGSTHFNPAVSLAFWAKGNLASKNLMAFWAVQFVGAVLAAFTIKMFFGNPELVGNNIPKVNAGWQFLTEFGFSFTLMLTILFTEKMERYAPFLVSLVVGVNVYLAGLYTTLGMNPARSFGPALATNNYTQLLIFISAPMMGMLLSIFIFKNYAKEKPAGALHRK
ncbi:MAG: aquaporin [Flavobacteriales bacterium]|nr:aquaporin [Flavobacteriales bacterium]